MEDAQHPSYPLPSTLTTKVVSLHDPRGDPICLLPADPGCSSSAPALCLDLDGRVCHGINNDTTCCLPCPIYSWVYPDSFDTMTTVANWISVVGTVCCVFLLLSWACLPVENTHRHYLSICLTVAVIFMNVSSVLRSYAVNVRVIAIGLTYPIKFSAGFRHSSGCPA